MLFAKASMDRVWWINTFVYTLDPRELTAKIPMVLFPLQEELILWLEEREANREGGVIEKSRDFGLTWLSAAYAIHSWLFKEGSRTGFGSRKLELVDSSEDDKTIFFKLRFILGTQPWWMRPAPKRYLSKYCLLKNYENDASISGEGGDEIGRGDRTSVYFVDEAASLLRPKLSDASLSQTTNCRIDISTAKGTSNSFYKRRHSGNVPVFTCLWKADPRKNHYIVYDAEDNVVGKGNGFAFDVPAQYKVVYPWYEETKKKLDDDVIVAQEVDIDYNASVEGICIPAKWVAVAVNLHHRIRLPQNGPVRATIDLAGGGANRNVLGFRRGVVVGDILSWKSDSQGFVAMEAKREVEERGGISLLYDTGGGFGGGMADMARSQDNPPKFRVGALRNNDPASLTEWPDVKQDGTKFTARDKFANVRAECYWLLRERFRRTWEFVVNGRQYDLSELISIPNNSDLISDLSRPLVEYSLSKKIQIESKEKMRERGVASPDFADMLAMQEAPEAVAAWWSSEKHINELLDAYRAHNKPTEEAPKPQTNTTWQEFLAPKG